MNDLLEKIAKVEQALTGTGSAVLAQTRFLDVARQFFRLEAAGGIVLALAALAAILIANSPLHGFYDYIFNEVRFRVGFSDASGLDLELKKPLLLWINDGLMAVFFFLIGLEIKREVVDGELSSRDRVALPFLAAIGGMAVPALVFWFFTRADAAAASGWAIPAATDIAFALAVISFLGSRVPVALKVLLTAIAVVDDLLAIGVIALFYGHDIHVTPLYFALAAIVCLFVLNRRNVTHVAPYVLTAIVLWVAVLESGVHATLAGVVAALFVPMSSKARPDYSLCREIEHGLHPWVAFGVLPLFGFANAGVSLQGLGAAAMTEPVTLGILFGLFAGKQIGVFAMLALVIGLKLSPMPKDVSWLQLYAVSVLCGIGFTMSLFIGGLAYEGQDMQAYVRLGVIAGSLLSAAAGYALLRMSAGKQCDSLSR